MNVIPERMDPKLTAFPCEGLLDDPLQVAVDGLTPGQHATVVVRFGGRWRGRATFVAGPDGRVDLTKQAPIDGNYEGVRPMGLIQYAQPIEVPSATSMDRGYQLYFSLIIDGDVVDSASVVRHTLPPSVERVAVDAINDRLVGELLLPPGDGPYRGVLFLGGSEGGIPADDRAHLLAAHGYAVLTLAYFQPSSLGSDSTSNSGHDQSAYTRLPERLLEIPIEYFDEAINWLLSRPQVADSDAAIVGVSRGTEPAVFTAARIDAVSAVVLISPLAYAFASFQEFGAPVWTIDGEPVPYLTNTFRVRDLLRYAGRRITGAGIPFESSFVTAVERASPEDVSAAALPVEDVSGHIRAFAGAADELAPSAFMCELIGERLADCGGGPSYCYYNYPATGHRLAAPYLPAGGRAVDDVPFSWGMPLAYGGTTDGYASADPDAWRRILRFLDQTYR